MSHSITSPVYVCQDNIDTDQIIPAQYLTLVPTIAEEYEKLGSYAMIGLPDHLYPQKFVAPGGLKTPYQIALETYYGELDKSGPDGPLEKSSAAAKAAITANPASLETRLLHLNILLQRAFLNPPVPNASTEFVAEFKRLHLRPPGLPAQDWAAPRIYVTFGDYLLRLGNQAEAHTAKAAYQSASDFYSLGHRMAAATKEAAQEKDNALDGYVQAQRGMYEATRPAASSSTSCTGRCRRIRW